LSNNIKEFSSQEFILSVRIILIEE
jgi:hypothetical protein